MKKTAAKQAEQNEQTAAAPLVYTFQHKGHEVNFHRATVRSAIEAGRLVQSLLRAYGHVAGNPASDARYALFREYAAVMARTETSAPWHADSNMSDDEVKQKFEIFIALDEDLYQEYRTAAAAFTALKMAQAGALTSSGG